MYCILDRLMILTFYTCCLFNDIWHRLSILDLSACALIIMIKCTSILKLVCSLKGITFMCT